MGDLVLHPTHYIFQNGQQPACPICEQALLPMTPVVIAKTDDRSVVGFLVDFAKMIPYHLEADAWDERTLPSVEAKLARTPCHAGKRFEDVFFPDRAAAKLLVERWHGVDGPRAASSKRP